MGINIIGKMQQLRYNHPKYIQCEYAIIPIQDIANIRLINNKYWVYLKLNHNGINVSYDYYIDN